MKEVSWIRNFRLNLIDLLKEANITPKELAKESCLDVKSIYRYLNGESVPTVRAAVNMYLVLSERIRGLTMDEFIYFGDMID